MADYSLILASRSPRRRELLARAGFEFTICPPEVDELVEEGWTPEECAVRLARQKVHDVVGRLAQRGAMSGDGKRLVVLGADTVVALGDKIFGKPKSPEHAYNMLWTLSRNPHRVITGVCLWPLGSDEPLIAWDVTYVNMRPMTDFELISYIESGEGMDKAGGYAIQETADRYIKSIVGAYDNVVGLPIDLVSRLLARWERGHG